MLFSQPNPSENQGNPLACFQKPSEIFAHPLTALIKPLQHFESSILTRCSSAVSFCPFNRKALVYTSWRRSHIFQNINVMFSCS